MLEDYVDSSLAIEFEITFQYDTVLPDENIRWMSRLVFHHLNPFKIARDLSWKVQVKLGHVLFLFNFHLSIIDPKIEGSPFDGSAKTHIDYVDAIFIIH